MRCQGENFPKSCERICEVTDRKIGYEVCENCIVKFQHDELEAHNHTLIDLNVALAQRNDELNCKVRKYEEALAEACIKIVARVFNKAK